MWPFKKEIIHFPKSREQQVKEAMVSQLNMHKQGLKDYPEYDYIIKPHIHLYEKQLKKFEMKRIKLGIKQLKKAKKNGMKIIPGTDNVSVDKRLKELQDKIKNPNRG